MPDIRSSTNPFLQKVIAAIEENLADENFGVTELADQIHMSRSNLLRKIKQETGLSVSVFIRNVRLQHGKQLLKDGALTVSEISYKVGFNSVSYFTKCFREEYGYTPGEESSQGSQESATLPDVGDIQETKTAKAGLLVISLLESILLAVFIYFFFFKGENKSPSIN